MVNKIIEIEHQLSFRLTWEHVHGHQDDKKKWYKLTKMEALNVQAGLHATDGLDVPGDIQTAIALTPSSKIGPASTKQISPAIMQRIFEKQRQNQR